MPWGVVASLIIKIVKWHLTRKDQGRIQLLVAHSRDIEKASEDEIKRANEARRTVDGDDDAGWM